MMQRAAPPSFPEALEDDDDDVTWALETAAVQWKRGAHADALEWLRRAAESAVDGGRATRARELTQSTNAIEMALRAGWAPAVPQTPLPPRQNAAAGGSYSYQRASVPPGPDSPRPFPLRTPRPPANPFLASNPGFPLRMPSRVPTPFGPPVHTANEEDGAEPLDSEAYGEVAVDIDLEAELLVPSQPAHRRSRPALESLEEIEAVETEEEEIEEFDDADVIALSLPSGQRSPAPRAPLVSAPEVEAEELDLDDALIEDDEDEIEEAEIELEPDEDDDRPTAPPSSKEPFARRPVVPNRPLGPPAAAAKKPPQAAPRPAARASFSPGRTSAPLSSKPPGSQTGSRQPKAAAMLRAQLRTERRLSESSEPPAQDSKSDSKKPERYRFRRREREPEPKEELLDSAQEEPTERSIEPAPVGLSTSTLPDLSGGAGEEPTERTLEPALASVPPRSPSDPVAISVPPSDVPPVSVSSLPPARFSSEVPRRDSETPDTQREERLADSSPEAPAPAVNAPSAERAETPRFDSLPVDALAADSLQPVVSGLLESTTPEEVFVTSSVPMHADLPSESADAAMLAPTSAPLPALSSLAGAVAPASALPSAEPPAERPTSLGGLSLAEVPGLEDLPEESQADLVEKAEIHHLGLNEEVSGFGMALILDGTVAVMPEIADVMAAPARRGDLVFCTGHLEDGVALRVVALADGAEVATWPSSAFDAAIRDCPWVGDELKNVGDRLQALSGVLMGPMGDQLDDQLRALVIERCEVRRLLPNEVIAEAGKGLPGMVIVGAGRLEMEGPSGAEHLGPGEFLFPQQILTASPAPVTVRAAKGGAIVLFTERKIAHELMVSVPPLLLIFAQ